MVIDTHTHAWGPPTPDHPWVSPSAVESFEAQDVDIVFTGEKLEKEMDRCGIHEAVVVGYPVTHWEDNVYVVSVASNHDRLSGIVMVDPFATNAASVLREYLTVDDVLGFRLGAICPRDKMWETFDPESDWLRNAINQQAFWDTAQEEDAVVQILAHVDQLDQVVELVRNYPDLTYLIDHVAMARPEKDPEDEFRDLAHLADYGTVGVKVSNIPYRSNETFPYEDMHPHVDWLIDRFGRERVLWGSDFPNVSDVATYRETIDWLDHVSTLSRNDIRWMTERSFPAFVA